MPDVPATIQVSSSSPDATVQELSASARTAAGEPFAAGPAGLARPADARVVTLSGAPGFGGATAQGGQRSTSAAYATDESPTVEELLEDGLHLAGASPVHLAIRGTAAADSVRCAWRGVARTAQQREDAIRFWLQLGPTDAIPAPAYLEVLFATVLDTLASDFRETAKANFLAIARGGESMDYSFLTCFTDYAVTNFLLGTGTTPTTVTVAYDRMDEAAAYDLYVREHDTGTYGPDPLQPAENTKPPCKPRSSLPSRPWLQRSADVRPSSSWPPWGRITRSGSRPGRRWRNGRW